MIRDVITWFVRGTIDTILTLIVFGILLAAFSVEFTLIPFTVPVLSLSVALALIITLTVKGFINTMTVKLFKGV